MGYSYMTLPAQVVLMMVRLHGAGQSTHQSTVHADGAILPMALQWAICSPLFDLAARRVLLLPARRREWIVRCEAIGRIALSTSAADWGVDRLAPWGWTLVNATCAGRFVYEYAISTHE